MFNAVNKTVHHLLWLLSKNYVTVLDSFPCRNELYFVQFISSSNVLQALTINTILEISCIYSSLHLFYLSRYGCGSLLI
jgi:hypothetical protein